MKALFSLFEIKLASVCFNYEIHKARTGDITLLPFKAALLICKRKTWSSKDGGSRDQIST